MPKNDAAASSRNRPAARARCRREQVLRLPAELGIEGVAALKEQLRGLLDQPATVILDAGEVARIHSAALQLFCLFCGERRAAGRAVEFARPSAALLSAAALLGASTLLQLAGAAA